MVRHLGVNSGDPALGDPVTAWMVGPEELLPDLAGAAEKELRPFVLAAGAVELADC